MGIDQAPGLARDYQRLMQRIFQASCLHLAMLVIRRTPVDTGVLRASWTPAVNGLDNSNAGYNQIISTCARLQVGDSFALVNGQAYVRPIEYEGRSQQAPAGMLRVSCAQWETIVRTEAARHVR